MAILDFFRQWRERRIERLTTKATDLKEDQQYDLLILHERGFIRANASGQSITEVYAEVENLIRKKLCVIVKPGTYFVSSSGHQNMATTKEYTFTLWPCSTERLHISAACINANMPIPGKGARFKGVSKVSDNVARFLEASRGSDPMVIQAGVWTLTDNYSRYEVINHLITKDRYGSTSHPITSDHCDKAKAILEGLGISHRLWYSLIPYEKKTVKLDNGSYTGEFRHGEKHGRGKYTWNSGHSYDGEWKSDKHCGQGIYGFANGDYYEGLFEDGREVGGWYHYANGNKQWCFRNDKGEWVNTPPPDETHPVGQS
jgi:hypothetical protein